jgi:hypothetical protein
MLFGVLVIFFGRSYITVVVSKSAPPNPSMNNLARITVNRFYSTIFYPPYRVLFFWNMFGGFLWQTNGFF